MSSIIKFSVVELRRLAALGTACVEERRVTQSLALQPWCLANLKDSIKNLLDYKIGKFDKEYDGILLSYKNLHILQNVGAIRNDHTDIHFQVQADYFIFRPYIGAMLTGIVNKKSLTHLGIIVHRVFNVVIPRPTEEPGSRWIGARAQEGQEVVFKIIMLDLYGALPYIRGELDERCLINVPEGECEPEIGRIIPDTVIVSHVNFDKTKPHARRQIGDSPEESKPRTSPPKTTVEVKHSNKSNSKLVKSKYQAANGIAKSPTLDDDKILDKNKQKRAKLCEMKLQQQQPGSNSTVRQNKKHKRKESTYGCVQHCVPVDQS